MKKKHWLKTVTILMLCMTMTCQASASILTLPEGTKIIEEEAFYGDTSIDEVVLPEGVEEIGERAFAESGLTRINLPSSLGVDSIADNAFDPGVEIIAEDGTAAYDWAVSQGYIDPHVIPEALASEFDFVDATGTIKAYTGHRKAVRIPASIRGKTVERIARSAFEENVEINTLIIPNTVTVIEDNAFKNCLGLKYVESPVAWSTNAGVWPFYGCVLSEFRVTGAPTEIPNSFFARPEFSAMGKVIIPETITSIGDNAFSGCSQLISLTTDGATRSVVFPTGLVSIGENAFLDCYNLTSIQFPHGLKTIGAHAFGNCSGLESDLKIPDTVIYIGDYAFQECTGIKNVESPLAWSTNAGVWPFHRCALSEFKVTGTPTEIPNSFFARDEFSSLEKVIIPETITSIGNNAFNGCYLLTSLSTDGTAKSVRFPQNLVSIGDRAFSNCTGITSVEFPNGLKTIGDHAFANCAGLICDLKIPETVTTIYDYAFQNCQGLRNVESPIAWLTNSGVWPFHLCMLTEFRIIGTPTELPQYTFAREEFSSLEKVIIPETITSIGRNAFAGCSQMTSMTTDGAANSVNFPAGLTSIGEEAFRDCAGLTKIELPDGLETIGRNAFAYCTGLGSELRIPETVTSIGDYAFQYCYGLQSVETPLAWSPNDGIWPFYCCVLKVFRITGTPADIPSNCFARTEYSALERIVLPGSIESIQARAFADCSALKVINIGDNTSYIADNAFENHGEDLIIFGVPGSYAEDYALAKEIHFSSAWNLNVSASVTAEGMSPYAQIHAAATASQGDTPYTYSYCLYCDNVPVKRTEYIRETSYTFDIEKDGIYKVLVSARDSLGRQSEVYTDTVAIGRREGITVRGCVYDDYGIPVEDVSVTMAAVQNAGGTFTASTDAEGNWSLNDIQIGTTYTVTVSKANLDFGTPLSFKAEKDYDVLLEPIYAAGNGSSVYPLLSVLNGYLCYDDGSPAEGIGISLRTEHGTTARTTWTDHQGRWAFSGLTDGQTYTVSYGEGTLIAVPASETIVFSASKTPLLSAEVMRIDGTVSDDITYTMSPTSVVVHNSVEFDISCPADAVAVRLVVDGKPYDVLSTYNGSAHLDRIFNLGGQRRVAFQITRDGTTWEETSRPQILNVSSDGKLRAPNVDAVNDHLTGLPLRITWDIVPFAEEYIIYLSRNGSAVDRLVSDHSYIDIPAYDFELPGSYAALVMATGTGYDQSESSVVFNVEPQDYQLSITETAECADRGIGENINITVNQSNGYVLLRIETPSGTTWYPGAGVLISQNEYNHTIATPTAGVYSVTPYLYTINPLRNDSVPYLTGKTLSINVTGPSIKNIYPGGHDWTWLSVGESKSHKVTTNNAVDTVEIYEGSTMLGSQEYVGETTTKGDRQFTVTLGQSMSVGRHTITIKGKSSTDSAEAASDKSFYVVNTGITQYSVYAQAETLDIYSSPLLSAKTTHTVAIVQGGENIERLTCIGNAGDFLQVRTPDGTEGFAASDYLAETAWTGASGKISFVEPVSDLSFPMGIPDELDISWNCGIPVPDGAAFNITLTPLTGSNSLNVTTSEQTKKISLQSLAVDEYTLQVKLVQNGSVLAESETRTINIGNFTLEQAYRDWWMKDIKHNYVDYLERGEDFDEDVSVWHGWGGFIPLNVRGMRPIIIFEPATLGYKQMLEDFKDLDKDSKVHSVENYHLVYQDQNQLRRTALMNIAAAMIEEKEAGNLILKDDLSNVSEVAQSNQTNSVRESEAQMITQSADAVFYTTKISVNTYKATHPGLNTEVFDNVMDVTRTVLDIQKDTWLEYLKTQAVLDVLSASADQYAYLLDAACDTYVECLEKTYLGDDWNTTGTYSSYVKEYVDKFKSLKANPENLHNIAMEQLLEGSGYTMSHINQLQKACLMEAGSEAVMSTCLNTLVYGVNKYIKQNFGISADLLKYEDGGIKLNPEAPLEFLLTAFVQPLTTDAFKNQLKDTLKQQMKMDNPAGGAVKKIQDKIKVVDALDSILSIAFDSWDLGCTLGEMMVTGSRLSDLSNNKGYFDTYGLDLVMTMKLRQDAYLRAGLTDHDWEREGDLILIKTLETYRNALATLVNYDLSILRNYRNMRVINDSNGFKFKYGIDWLTTAEIDSRIKLVTAYRDWFVIRPSVFDSLFK